MSALKTQPTKASVSDFVNHITPDWKRKDCQTLLKIMEDVTGEQPVMWGDSVVGFGQYHYKYKTGREGDWYRTGFSSRKANLTIYCPGGFADSKDLLAKLGKHTTSAGCVYVKKLSDIDLDVLKQVVINSVDQLRAWFEQD